MKRVAFAIGVLALGFAASSPARADFAVVKFEDGYCRIWWDSSATPWGDNWQKIAMAPDWAGAWAALGDAIRTNICR
jgi:hypothetical protein